MAEERERITRLETRAREADNALQQLKSYIEILKKKASTSSTGAFSEETKHLEQENSLLKAEVAQLRQQLVVLEVKNGVTQIPMPSQGARPPPQTSTPPPPTTKPQQPSQATGEEVKKAIKKEKKEKGGKREKAPPASDVPVDVSRLDFRIGKIVKAWKHPDADTLYVEEVDVGEGRVRTVCSGLTKHIPLDQMQARVAMFLCNLKPAKMRGVSSEAMIMCASTPEKVEILDPPPGCEPGDRVYCEGYKGTPDAMLNPKKKIFESVQPDLRTNEEGVACYKDQPFRVEGKEGLFRAATMRGTGIK